jgi:hypothetical protein
MTTLSPDLKRRCREAFVQCRPFENDPSLRALFKTTSGLADLSDSLPEADDNEERALVTINYLLKRSTEERPIYRDFINALIGECSEESEPDLYQELTECLRCVEKETLKSSRPASSKEEIEIPFVIVAMTDKEASELVSEKAFDKETVPPAERKSFRTFLMALQEQGIKSFEDSYGPQREDWKPIADSCESDCQASIVDHVQEICKRLNDIREGDPGRPPIKASFLSADFFEDANSKNNCTWDVTCKQFTRSGGVLIVDAISLFHPDLHERLASSEISSHENVAILILSPVSSKALEVNDLIENVIDSKMKRAYWRYVESLDEKCEIGLGGLCNLRRWLFAILPEEAEIVGEGRANPDSAKSLKNRLGPSRGLYKAVLQGSMP